MKQGKLITTHNVAAANACIAELQTRPKLEMVGLGLIYGAPGLGKTTFAQRSAYRHKYIYLRLESTTTTKTFAQALLRAVHRHAGLGDVPTSGTANGLFKRAIELLTAHSDAIIIIDEIDYAFKRPDLLGAIRDIVDETIAIVILVGMENAKERLLQINRYYFDRCSQFYQFTPATLPDLTALAQAVMEVHPADDVIAYIHRLTDGNLRQAVNVMDAIEKDARARKLSAISMADLEDRPA
jgi:replication-associated recombination protein RarA